VRKTILVGVLMTVVLLGCNKNKKAVKSGSGDQAPPPAAGSAPGGSNGATIVPAGGIGVVTNPNQALGGGGGGGAAGAVRKAADRTQIRFALQDIRLLLNDYSLANDKLPTPQETLALVKQGATKYAKFIEDGDIVINAAKTREDVWAYEAKAPFGKHMVLTAQGIEDMDPEGLRQRLGMR